MHLEKAAFSDIYRPFIKNHIVKNFNLAEFSLFKSTCYQLRSKQAVGFSGQDICYPLTICTFDFQGKTNKHEYKHTVRYVAVCGDIVK